MKKEEIYLNTSVLSSEQLKNVARVLLDNGDTFYSETLTDLENGVIHRRYTDLHFNTIDKIWVRSFNSTKIEINYGQFMQMFNDNVKEQSNVMRNKQTKITLTKELVNINRKVTIVVVVTDVNQIKIGYSILNPEDKHNQELSEKIAYGRAMNERTNLSEMELGYGMEGKKYILYAIAEQTLRDIDNRKIIIKGIK